MDGYTREELDEALTAVQSIIHKCEAAQKKFPRGTAHHTLLAVEASYPITWAVTSVAILLYYRFGRWLHPPKKA